MIALMSAPNMEIDMRVPELCYTTHPQTGGKIIAVKRGDPIGYAYRMGDEWTRQRADQANGELGVSPAQREAMVAGMLYGWDRPEASPETAERTFPQAAPLHQPSFIRLWEGS